MGRGDGFFATQLLDLERRVFAQPRLTKQQPCLKSFGAWQGGAK